MIPTDPWKYPEAVTDSTIYIKPFIRTFSRKYLKSHIEGCLKGTVP
jgi:hypothetical protein